MTMLRVRLLKQKLLRECRKYSYKRLIDEREVESLLGRIEQINPRTSAELIVGCVRLTAVLFHDGERIRLGFDLYAKDSPESNGWILFENLSDDGDSGELSMLKILDSAVGECGLSYTECSFATLSGERIPTERK